MMTTFDHLTELFSPDGYTLISVSGSTPRWTLLGYGTEITSWTMPHRPSLLALLKAIKLWEEWDDWDWDVDCTGAYRSRPPFKTYHPRGQKFETKILELI